MSREQMKARLEAASDGPWELYDSNDGEWPPRPLWSVANDEFHNPSGGEDDSWPAFNAYVETGTKEDAEFIAHAPTDLAKLHAALDAVEALPHEDYCCTKGCPGFGLATCGKVFTNGDECDGAECSCFMSGPLQAIRHALGEDA